MVDNTLDLLRHDALRTRWKGVAGGNCVHFPASDFPAIQDRVMSMSEKALRAATTVKRAATVAGDFLALQRSLVETSNGLKREMHAEDTDFLGILTTPRTDLVQDRVVEPKNVDCKDFNNNRIIPFGHDTSALPVATSTAPWVSNGKLMAIAKFPKPGINARSDEVAAAIRAGLLKGISIGFIPTKWKFSSDPARPLGIDFEAIKLLEWSWVSLPCNPDCLLLGSVASSKSATLAEEFKVAERQRQARELTASASQPTLTREQRIAEAAKIRRAIYSV